MELEFAQCLYKLYHNICSHIGDNADATLFPVLEIKESPLVEKCLCLHISPKHAGVHSFIYILLEKLRNIYLRVVCVQFSIPSLLLDSSMAAMFGLPNDQIPNAAVIYLILTCPSTHK